MRIRDMIRRLVGTPSAVLDPGAVGARAVDRIDPSSLRRLRFENETLVSRGFADADVDDFGAVASVFDRCDFSGLKAESASFGGGGDDSRYVECSFDRARIAHSIVGRARFERCTFRDVRLGQFWAQDAEFVGCVFSGSIRQAIFHGCPLHEDVGRTRNEFVRNDFAGAFLHDVAFRAGVDLSDQDLPTGANYLLCSDGKNAVARARARIGEHRGAPDYGHAESLIQVLERDLRNGQGQLFLCLSSLERKGGPATDAILQALASADA
jgi:uncharacterized protein YjbI with pentapeptide repeats